MGCEHYGDVAGGLIFGNPLAVKNDADARRYRRGEADPDKFGISFACSVYGSWPAASSAISWRSTRSRCFRGMSGALNRNNV